MFLPLCLHGGQRLRERKHEQELVYNPDERFDVDPDEKGSMMLILMTQTKAGRS